MASKRSYRRKRSKTSRKGSKSYRRKGSKSNWTYKTYKKKGNFVAQTFRVYYETLTVQATQFIQEEYSPSLSNIPANDLDGYTKLYDEYRIVSIMIEYVRRTNPNDANVRPFEVYSVIDKTDTGSITTAQALEYNNCVKKLSVSRRPVYRKFKPSVTTILFDVNGNPFVCQNDPMWIQLANSTPITINAAIVDSNVGADSTMSVDPVNNQVAHIGVKVVSEINPADAADQIFDVYITYNVQFRTKN